MRVCCGACVEWKEQIRHTAGDLFQRQAGSCERLVIDAHRARHFLRSGDWRPHVGQALIHPRKPQLPILPLQLDPRRSHTEPEHEVIAATSNRSKVCQREGAADRRMTSHR